MPPNTAFNARVYGLEQVQDMFSRKMPREFPRFVRMALREATKPTLAVMRRNAAALKSSPAEKYSAKQWLSGGPGRLEQALGKKEKTYRNTGTFIIVLGPRIDSKWEAKGKHGHVVEGGSWKSGMRWHPLTGTSGRMPAFPFLAPAVNATRGRVRRILFREVVRRMQSWWRGKTSFRAMRVATSILRGSIVTGL